MHLRPVISLLLVVLIANLNGQSLPANPDPDKCYIRLVAPDIYHSWEDSVLTYSNEEASLYPNEVVQLITKPAVSKWESTQLDDCESDDPSDCQVLCYRTYPAEVFTYFKPLDESVGNPFFYPVEGKRLISKGGLTAYREIDCHLKQPQELTLTFGGNNDALTAEDKTVIREKMLPVFQSFKGVKVQLSVGVASSGNAEENEAKAERLGAQVLSFLKAQYGAEADLSISAYALHRTDAEEQEDAGATTIVSKFRVQSVEQYQEESRQTNRRRGKQKRKRSKT